jgi:hypothetical protein
MPSRDELRNELHQVEQKTGGNLLADELHL